MRFRSMMVAVVAVGAVGLTMPAPAQGSLPPLELPVASGQLVAAVRLTPPKPPVVSPATTVLDLVNAQRAAHGLPAFVYDARLQLAAQHHSEDQARMSKMSHVGSDGSSLSQRIDRVGFSWRSAAENVAYGYRTPAAVVDAWMKSDGHRRNILSANTHLGVGLAYSAGGVPYWTQVFAAPR